MTLGGETHIYDSFFLFNSATSRGLAISATASSPEITRSSFESNELYCAAGLYRHDTEEVGRRKNCLYTFPRLHTCSRNIRQQCFGRSFFE